MQEDFLFQENCEDPPAFRESRRRANEELKRKEEQKAKEIELEVVMIIYCFLTYSFRVTVFQGFQGFQLVNGANVGGINIVK